jgi:major membrane immunogen (membrane-anchored lipoprotein)
MDLSSTLTFKAVIMFNDKPGVHSAALFLRYPRAAIAVLITLLLALMTACATHQAITLKVNSRHVQGVQYAPQEVTHMMTDLGYQQLRVKDPVTEQSVAVAEKYGEYRLLFQSLEDNSIRVDIHIDKTDGRIALYLYNTNNSPPGEASLRLYAQLRQRLESEYGEDNVSSSLP